MSDDAESTTVKLRSKQEQLFEVEWAVACRSATLAIFDLDDAGFRTNAVPLKMTSTRRS